MSKKEIKREMTKAKKRIRKAEKENDYLNYIRYNEHLETLYFLLISK